LVPVFFLLGLSAHLLIRSALLRELEQIGISSGKTLASEIVAQRLLRHSDPGSLIESRVREFLYLQPNIRRIEVYAPDAQTQVQKIIASSIEEDPAEVLGEPPAGTDITTQLFEKEDAAERRWVVWVPIRASTIAGKTAAKPLGYVRVEVSINSVSRLAGAVTKATLIGGFFGVIVLFFLLNGVLRRTIENDRKLKEAEKENLVLSEQLHEA